MSKYYFRLSDNVKVAVKHISKARVQSWGQVLGVVVVVVVVVLDNISKARVFVAAIAVFLLLLLR